MMHAEVIDLLSGKGKFSTEEAVVLAEAMGLALEKAQVVTVPILDARFAALDRRFADIDRRFADVDIRFASVDARLDRLETRMESGFAVVDARFNQVNYRFDVLEAKFDAKMLRWAVLIIISTVLSQAALGPVGASALESAKKALSTLVR